MAPKAATRNGAGMPGRSAAPRRRSERRGLTILDRILGDDPATRHEMKEESERLDIAQVIYDARTAAGLTQAELARKARTTQPVIARLEDSDYRGHSMRLLQRIAEVLGCRLRVQLVPKANTKP